MSMIHILNVKNGVCSLIEHNSGHITVIDVCNAKTPEPIAKAVLGALAKVEHGIAGNFQQKKYPVNPISYMHDHKIKNIFRYVQTHPDMDHMDGITALFDAFNPVNFWDTDNKKEMPNLSWKGSPYSKKDWEFYKRLRDANPKEDPKRLTLLSGDHGKFWNVGKDGSRGGDGLHILAPTQELLDAANEEDDEFNDCSYVLMGTSGNLNLHI